jgi:hypothetical protein
MKNHRDAQTGSLLTVDATLIRLRDSLPFVGRRDQVIVENDGAVQTWRARAKSWPMLIEGHLRGKRRLGLFPMLPNGRCRWGALDLDAHTPDVPDRRGDALAVLETLDNAGILGYMAPSRSGRGWHVFMLFEDPGVAASNLHPWLEGLAGELRIHGPVDVFPSSATGVGRAVFLPGFGSVMDILSVDLEPVSLDKVEANAVSVIPATAPSWPPKTWRLASAGGKGREFAEQVRELRAQGLAFERVGVLQARDGARNKIAGAIAREIVRRGGTFEDFARWDSGNVPPLGNDEPEKLAGWWRWAKGQEQAPRRGNPAHRQRPQTHDRGAVAADGG